ncbi:C6 zinc finger domain-containing protein [Neofusicoccum parvum]|uniref:C6 zinc finger domain-containing protein n=1 Tax=Neofusicoccum parvum TaxID=310453 RepID=A0ACB5S9F3_9PEZI|nr:C6 zinc finger domain-containing protein [Neofusicoccum parvum]GME49321.1 C6 zinc finger domain-containing protein [Neofusicoccum parvum]
MWPASLPADFRDHVGLRHPVALVILAHYAALVGCFRDRWYLDGWSEHVFEALDEALDEGWREWLEYPRSFGPKDLEEAVREMNERPRDDDGDAAPEHDCPLGR